MDERVGEHGLGMGPVFVHKLTSTDVYHNGLRIPSVIVDALNILESGWVNLAMGEYNNVQEAECYTTTDGRLRFKSGWTNFVQAFGLNVGVVVLILFHMEWSGYVKIYFDRL